MNKFERCSKNFYNKIANNYDNTFDGKFTLKFNQALMDMIEINPGDTLADIACGNGRFLSMMAKKHSFVGLGTDISDEMIIQAKQLNPNMNFFVTGCDNLPFENNSIDVMTVSAAYHHFPDVSLFAREAYRVIRKGGMLYIAEVYLPAIIRKICNPLYKFSKAGDVKCYSTKEIISLFETTGFVLGKAIVDGRMQIIILQSQKRAQ